MSQLTLVFISAITGAIGQVLLKAGANSLGEYNLDFTHLIASIITVIKIPQILLGLVFFGSSFLLSLKVLTKSDLSWAYPLTSISYVIVAIAAAIFFDEAITMNKMLGIGAIVLGVFILNK